MKKLVIPIIKYFREVPFGLRCVNFFFQRILRIDSDVRFSKNFTSRIVNSHRLEIENESKSVLKSLFLSGGCYIQAGGGIIIGEGTIIGPQVALVSWDHDTSDFNTLKIKGPIKIGKKCWLACGAKIMSGVILGDNTIVAAGAVVTKSFPQGNCIIGGIPARIIKNL